MQKFLLQVIRPARKPTNQGIPFSDPCSQRLRQWMGISSEQLYNPRMAVILPMGFSTTQVPENRVIYPLGQNVRLLGGQVCYLIFKALK